MGCVGRAIAQRLRGFGCRLLGVDACAAMPAGVEGVSLDTALSRADLLILALPLTGATRHLIGERELGLARRGALWVNIGRGSVVDEAAMARHLASGHAGGYAADVFECEDWGLPDRPVEVSVALRRTRTHSSRRTSARLSWRCAAPSNTALSTTSRPCSRAWHRPMRSTASACAADVGLRSEIQRRTRPHRRFAALC